jgi:diguanylate cyclase (GGDEF)-like protein
MIESTIRTGRSLLEAARRVYDDRIAPLAARFRTFLAEQEDRIRRQWEESDYDVENPLHRLRGQFLLWFFSMAKRWRKSDKKLRSYYLPLSVALISVLLAKTFHSGGLAILIAGVIVSVRMGGLRSGLLTTLVTFVIVCLLTQSTWHGRGGVEIAVVLAAFLLTSILACTLIDSLEIARQEVDTSRIAAEAVARRFRFLAEATAMLETEYSYEAILMSVTKAIVPAYADWAMADVFREGQLRRTAIAHRDEAVAVLLRTAHRNRSLAMQSGHPLYEALFAREARIFTDVSDDILAPLRLDHQDAPGLKPRHLLFVPLTARNRLLGALTLVSTQLECPFSAMDLFAARDLALRVGTAMDNLQLYYGALDEAAENARREREAANQKSLLEMERSELVEINARLEIEATTDGLTGLLNHLNFKRALDREFLRSQRTGSKLSLALLDVDRFKSYNDTFGHPAGDEVLRQLAEVMTETTRGSDIVARYGGEEFVIVMPDTDLRGALETIERLRHAIEAQIWAHRPVTASFGIATLQPSTISPGDLVAAADDALYRSKQAGRNRITYSEPMQEAVVSQRSLATATAADP